MSKLPDVDKLLFNRNYVHGLVGKIDIGKPLYKIVVLSGGGIDSFMSTVLAKKMIVHLHDHTTSEDDYDEPIFEYHFLTMDYGQTAVNAEIHMTELQLNNLKPSRGQPDSKAIVIKDGLMNYIRNPLANRASEKEKSAETAADYSKNDDYVPNRNARFIFNAAGYAETIGADVIVIGAVGNVNQDNSLIFLENAYETIKHSNRDHFPALYAPFVLMSKSMVAIAAKKHNKLTRLAYLTTSCFDAQYVTNVKPDKVAGRYNKKPNSYIVQCGVCRSCTSLKQAFKFAGITDPYFYAEKANNDDEATIPENPGKSAGVPKPLKSGNRKEFIEDDEIDLEDEDEYED